MAFYSAMPRLAFFAARFPSGFIRSGVDNRQTGTLPDFPVRVRSSRPGEFHPEALTEPYVTLSGQTALHGDSLSFLRTDPLEEKAPPGFPVGPQFPSALCHPLRSTPITGASSLLQDDPPSASASIFPLRGSHL